MKMLQKRGLFGNLDKKQILWALTLAIPAFYINLGMLPLIGDEAIRAVVSMEMMLSGDYITPTLNGEIYLNKPPLFNWVLIIFFKLFNSNNEFLVRLPTTLFLGLYGYTIYYWVNKRLGKQIGLLSALIFITCGRILFWDSFLGLIDIAYSWIMFSNFMIIWHYYEKRNDLKLFMISYLLTAIGFLLKGIPTLAFQGITLTVLFLSDRRLKALFTWKHAAGVILFMLLSGSYYFLYYLRNPGYLDDALIRLVTESTGKSAIGTGMEKTIIHFFTFPFELLYHFVPWMILFVFLMNRRIFKKAWNNRFIKYCMIIFGANIVIYWFSPVTYPRYLLMLVPLIFIVFLYFARMHALLKTRMYGLMIKLFRVVISGLVLASVLLPLVFANKITVDHLFLKVLMIMMVSLVIYIFMIRNQRHYGLFYIAVLVFLISRISFDIFLVPYRQSDSWMTLCRSDAIQLGKATAGTDMYVLADTITIHNVYYLTRERNEILHYGDNPVQGPYYIVDDIRKYQNTFSKEYSMRLPYQYKTYYAGKFTKQP